MLNLLDQQDVRDTVICDGSCGQDYTNSDDCGGILFGSYAYCPNCAKQALASARRYGEERFIKAVCPPDMSFKDFVLKLRGGNNTIKEYSFDKWKDLKNL